MKIKLIVSLWFKHGLQWPLVSSDWKEWCNVGQEIQYNTYLCISFSPIIQTHPVILATSLWRKPIWTSWLFCTPINRLSLYIIMYPTPQEHFVGDYPHLNSFGHRMGAQMCKAFHCSKSSIFADPQATAFHLWSSLRIFLKTSRKKKLKKQTTLWAIASVTVAHRHCDLQTETNLRDKC